MVSLDEWVSLIKDFHERKLPDLIEREIKIDLNMPLNRAYAVIGPRRAGKTFLLFQTIKELELMNLKKNCIYINFEKPGFESLKAIELKQLLEAYYLIYPENSNKKLWFFLDEIQNVSKWELFARQLIDEGHKVFISGSSSKMLSKEIATSMRGRTIEILVLPFSFKEFLKARKINYSKTFSSKEKALILNALNEFIKESAYPEAVIYSVQKEQIIDSIRNTVILKDVAERNKIKKTKTLKMLVNALSESKEFSVHKYYNYLKSIGIKISKNSLYEYVSALNDAFFVFPLKKFSFSYKKAEQSLPKIYFIDNAFIKSNNKQETGKLFENTVFIELLRQKKEISYFKSSNEKEVDFVLTEKKKVKKLIQACFDVSNHLTKEREITALIKASNELNCSNLEIITNDFESKEKIKEKTIQFIPLWKWLLS